jgi:hypothetical protein
MTRLLVLENWNSYRAEVLDVEGVGRPQIEACRHLWYAGALATWNALMNTITLDAKPTPAELAQLAAIDKELREYVAELWVDDLMDFAAAVGRDEWK